MTRAAAAAGTGLAAVVGALLWVGLCGCDRSEAPPAEPADQPAAREPPAATPGAETLRRIVMAEKSLAYTGTKQCVYGRGDVDHSMRMKVSRYASGHTLLDWDQGAGQTHRWSYRSRFSWLDDPELLLTNYEVSVDPQDGPEVASRHTRKLSIRGRRTGRPSLDLLVDKETSLVLREEFHDFEGRLAWKNEFESIEYREPDPPEPSITRRHLADPCAGRGPRDAARPVDPLPLAVTHAPPGFVRVNTLRGSCGKKHEDWTRREDWSDGLAAFSVTEYPARAETDPSKPARKEGEIQRRRYRGNASVSGVFGGIMVVVNGNLPVEELEAVIRGLVPVRESPSPGVDARR